MTTSEARPSLGRALQCCLCVLLAACGGGGGGGGGTSGGGGVDPTPTPSAESTSTPPVVVGGGGLGGGGETPPHYQPKGCFRVFDGDCLTNAELGAKAQELATEFKARREEILNNAWGTRADSFWYLERINVAEAQAHLELSRGGEAASFPGRGVTIGFIDSGIREQHKAFDLTASVTEELLPGAVDEGLDEFSHGTAVASVAAGRYGVAYGADIKMFAIPLGDGSAPYNPITSNQLSAADFENAERYRYVLSKDIDILNLSIAFQGGIEDYSELDLRNNYSSTIRVLAQEGYQDKTILVWAAGNEGNKDTGHATSSSPEILAGLVARIDELQGHSVAVVSIGRDGDISDFSNRCGIARDFCIAAPGEGVGVATTGNTLWTLAANGTSYAAPMVSGSLAVMKQLFRGQLSNGQLVSRLFATARDDGIYADAAIYGHGLLDLGAATQPWGAPGFMGVGQPTSAQGAPIAASSLAAGPALGDALSQALDSQDVAAFDSLGAPFWFDAGAFTAEAPGTTVAARLQEVLHPINRQPIPRAWQFHLQENSPATETGHLALANAASRLTIAGPQGISASLFQSPQRLQGLALSWNPQWLSMLSMGAGYINESESLLGSRANGAFGQLSADTVFLSAGLNTTAGRWTLAAAGEIGEVKPSLASSRLIDHVSPLTTSAFRLQASRAFDNGNTLRFSLSQPLRVDHGAATFSFPTGRTREGTVTGTSFSSSLAPSGRQLDLTTTLEMPLAGGDLSLGVTRSRQPGHQRTAAPEWSVFTGYRSTW